MRLLIFLSLLFGISCSSTKNAANPKQVNGTWVPIKQEIGGTPLPKAVYEKQQLILSKNQYTVIAESVDKGDVKVSGNKMDIYGKDGVNKGKHFTAIYKLENGQLSICYNLKGDSYPENFETKGKPLFFLSIFTRNK